MDAAGNFQIGIILFQCFGYANEGLQSLSPAELFDVIVHELWHFIAVIDLELFHAFGAAASPVIASAAGDGCVALGVGIVRLVPEETIHLSFLSQFQTKTLEVVPERVGVEAGRRQNLACISADLAVVDIVLQE